MKSVQKIDLGLTGYDELFMNDAERKENKLPRISLPTNTFPAMSARSSNGRGAAQSSIRRIIPRTCERWKLCSPLT